MQIKRRSLSKEISSLSGVPVFLQRIYAARGISEPEELNKQLQSLIPFSHMMGIDKACLRLEQALRKGEKILVIGDFDADGATSTALAVSMLTVLGCKKVDFLVPNRFEYGYGLTPAIVDLAHQSKPDLVITVDNGIASIEGVDRANTLGIDVIVTDHHLPGDSLPKACAIVNPNQPDCTFASKSIAGVGVIFYVMLALRRQLANSGWFMEQNMPEPNMAQALDLVALGTVADVVGLDHNNRILVSQGLTRIRQGLCRPGILALIEIAGREATRLRETDLGFAVAPRLNAAGRLDDMSRGIACLLSDSLGKAREYALELDSLNEERKQIESDMKLQAFQALEALSLNSQTLPPVLCLMDKGWHQGVIGILAGRLKEKFHRPAIIMAQVSDTELKGSARSIAGLNIRDVLAAVDRDYPGLITRFGGHAMAAGLSLHASAFGDFRTALEKEVSKHLDISQCEGVIWTDGALQPEEFNLETARLLHEAGPWGQQFPEPVFDNVFEILDQRIVGKNHLKLSLIPEAGGEVLDAIAFNIDLKSWPNHRATKLHAAYKLDINVWQGRSKLQLLIEAMMTQEG